MVHLGGGELYARVGEDHGQPVALLADVAFREVGHIDVALHRGVDGDGNVARTQRHADAQAVQQSATPKLGRVAMGDDRADLVFRRVEAGARLQLRDHRDGVLRGHL